MDNKQYIDKVINFSRKSKEEVNRFYKAVLRAVQYDAHQTQNEKFHLLEGTVTQIKPGVYIFKPNKHLEALLQTSDYPVMLKMEENRFADYLKMALLDFGIESPPKGVLKDNATALPEPTPRGRPKSEPKGD